MGSCAPIRSELAAALLQTDCVLKQGNSPQECLQQHLRELPDDCQQLYKSYVECRRGLLDMRKRFRGNAMMAQGSNPAPGGVSSVEMRGLHPSSSTSAAAGTGDDAATTAAATHGPADEIGSGSPSGGTNAHGARI